MIGGSPCLRLAICNHAEEEGERKDMARNDKRARIGKEKRLEDEEEISRPQEELLNSRTPMMLHADYSRDPFRLLYDHSFFSPTIFAYDFSYT